MFGLSNFRLGFAYLTELWGSRAIRRQLNPMQNINRKLPAWTINLSFFLSSLFYCFLRKIDVTFTDYFKINVYQDLHDLAQLKRKNQ